MRPILFTSFSDYSKAYSLNIVTENQIKQLLLAGYSPTVIVHDTFQPEGMFAHPSVTLEKIPNVPCHNEVKKDPTFDADVDALEKRLMEILKDGDVVITHDIVYQNACLKHNMAARRVADKLPGVRWLHWIHSATSPQLLSMVRPVFSDAYANLVTKPFPHAYYVYPNAYAIPSVAKNFGVDQELVKVVHHPTDICGFLGISPAVQEVVYQKDMLAADAICTYPVRLDTGKQVEMVVKTMAMLREFAFGIRVIIIDFHSTGPEKVEYREKIKQVAIDYGLRENELTFTSECNPQWEVEADQSVVRDFQLLSNVFILPSVSETYSLIAQEALLTKQVAVLNYDFPPFREIYGSDAIYRKFSSGFDVLADPTEAIRLGSATNTQYGPANLPPEARKEAEKAYHKETAGMIAKRLNHPEMAQAIRIRKERNLLSNFKRELEPLLYE